MSAMSTTLTFTPQSGRRSREYDQVMRMVLTSEGLPWAALIEAVAGVVTDERAIATMRRRRRRTPDETDGRAIAAAKRHVARAIIDRAHRNGRITYLDPDRGTRTVWQGDAPNAGGKGGRQYTWDDERARYAPTSPQSRRLHTSRPAAG
jgi:hypothetical protein